MAKSSPRRSRPSLENPYALGNRRRTGSHSVAAAGAVVAGAAGLMALGTATASADTTFDDIGPGSDASTSSFESSALSFGPVDDGPDLGTDFGSVGSASSASSPDPPSSSPAFGDIDLSSGTPGSGSSSFDLGPASGPGDLVAGLGDNGSDPLPNVTTLSSPSLDPPSWTDPQPVIEPTSVFGTEPLSTVAQSSLTDPVPLPTPIAEALDPPIGSTSLTDPVPLPNLGTDIALGPVDAPTSGSPNDLVELPTLSADDHVAPPTVPANGTGTDPLDAGPYGGTIGVTDRETTDRLDTLLGLSADPDAPTFAPGTMLDVSLDPNSDPATAGLLPTTGSDDGVAPPTDPEVTFGWTDPETTAALDRALLGNDDSSLFAPGQTWSNATEGLGPLTPTTAGPLDGPDPGYGFLNEQDSDALDRLLLPPTDGSADEPPLFDVVDPDSIAWGDELTTADVRTEPAPQRPITAGGTYRPPVPAPGLGTGRNDAPREASDTPGANPGGGLFERGTAGTSDNIRGHQLGSAALGAGGEVRLPQVPRDGAGRLDTTEGGTVLPGSTIAQSGAETPRSGSQTGNPWRISTFDPENWPPVISPEPQDGAYALLGVVPTVGITAMQRARALGTLLPAQLGAATDTLYRSFPSDILLGDFPVRFFEGDDQNSVARSVASGAVIAGLDRVANYAQDVLPGIQQRNREFWLNRNIGPVSEVTVRRGPTSQLSSGLNPLTVMAIAPTVNTLSLLGDRACQAVDCNPQPTDTNNNRYYGRAFLDALETGAGVFGPIFGENFATQRAANLRSGVAPPRAGNVALQTALAFGAPAAQSLAATILTQEPPDKTDPIYRGTRAVFRAIGDDFNGVNDTLFGNAREADGNNRNATRAVANAGAAVVTPVFDALAGVYPNVLHNLGRTYDSIVTGRPVQNVPIVSPGAVQSAEAARQRAAEAWRLTREGRPGNGEDAAMQALGNGLYAIGRGGIGALHTLASVADPFQSQESRFLDEPTQRQRGQESLAAAGTALRQGGDALNFLGEAGGRRLTDIRQGADRAVQGGLNLLRTGNWEAPAPIRYSDCSVPGQVQCLTPGTNRLVVGPGAPTRVDNAGRTMTRFSDCTVPGQSQCVTPDTNRLVVGPGTPTRVDNAGRTVPRQPDCDTAFQVQCVTPGTNRLVMGTGRTTTTLPDGRTVENVTIESLRQEIESRTPADYERAFRNYNSGHGAGAPSPALVNPVTQMQQQIQNGIGTQVERLGNTYNRAVQDTGNAIRRGGDFVQGWTNDRRNEASRAWSNLQQSLPWNRR